MQAFTPNTISNAQKATGLLPYNPTTILKTLTRIEPSKSQDKEELNIPTTLRTLKTLRNVREIKSLYNRINELTTTRLNGLLETPTWRYLSKLFKALIGFATDSYIYREENKKY